MADKELQKLYMELSTEEESDEIILRYIEKIQDAIAELDESLNGRIDSIDIDGYVEPLKGRLAEIEADTNKKLVEVENKTLKRIKDIETSVGGVRNELRTKGGELNNQLQIAKIEISGQIQNSLDKIKRSRKEIEDMVSEFAEDSKKSERSLKELIEKIKKELEVDIANKLSMASRGGSMNRQVFINSANPLTKYNDINLKPGTGTTITYSANDTTKKVDITITATGGPGGTSRTVETTAVSSVLSDTAGIDRVVICTQGVQLTLPTALSNTNLYTVKNTANSSVLVAPQAGQTIDADSNIILRTQYTAVDLISDGTSNWNIT